LVDVDELDDKFLSYCDHWVEWVLAFSFKTHRENLIASRYDP